MTSISLYRIWETKSTLVFSIFGYGNETDIHPDIKAKHGFQVKSDSYATFDVFDGLAKSKKNNIYFHSALLKTVV